MISKRKKEKELKIWKGLRIENSLAFSGYDCYLVLYPASKL